MKGGNVGTIAYIMHKMRL